MESQFEKIKVKHCNVRWSLKATLSVKYKYEHWNCLVDIPKYANINIFKLFTKWKYKI